MKSLINFCQVFINRKSFSLLILMSMFITLGSCGSDDDPEVIENAFLKRFDGEKWELEGRVAFKFNDDLNNPFAFWWKNEDDANCYFFADVLYQDDFEILEQTNDKFSGSFKLLVGDGLYQYLEFSFTVDDKGIIHANYIPLTKTDKILLRCDY